MLYVQRMIGDGEGGGAAALGERVAVAAARDQGEVLEVVLVDQVEQQQRMTRVKIWVCRGLGMEVVGKEGVGRGGRC